VALVAGDHHPAGAVAAGAVVLREAVQGDGQHVLGERRDRGVPVAVEEHLVVHLVGIDEEVMLAGDPDDLPEHFVRIQRTGRVVRVDDDDRLGLRRDLAADVLEVRQPAVFLVAQVMPRRAAGEADRRRPQRIVRCRHQHLVAGVEQCVHRHHDQLGHAVADIDVLQRHPLDVLLLAVVHDRLACGEDALRVGVARGVRQVADDVLLDLLRGIEAEGGEVADVQLDEDVRKQDYITAQNIIMENALAIPMFSVNTSYLTASSVQGFTFDMEGFPWLYDISIAP